MQQFAARYLPALDATLHDVVTAAPKATGFNIQLEYPLGWVDAAGRPASVSSGKRIRPLLLLLCTEAVGGDWQAALPAAVAVELLHNFSLIHDDIEDGSPLRHGRPTVWHEWGVANAINAGDAMFALAYTALAGLRSSVSDAIALDALDIVNQTNLDLTRGQHLDMRFETQPRVTTDEYLTMIEGKSAALLAAAAQLGALIGSRNTATATHFHAFGLNLGIAFQIRDDILGIWGDPAVTGKSAATDILARKKSLPALYALEQSADLRSLYAREPFGDAEVAEAVRILDSLNARNTTADLEAVYHQRALDALRAANPVGPAADGLHALVESLLERVA